MTIKLGVVMDPIESINPKKDSTLAMLLAAQRKGWELQYMLAKDIYTYNGEAFAQMQNLSVTDSPQDWFTINTAAAETRLSSLDVVLMRVDPPYNMEYIYTTYTLQLAAEAGVLVVNRPESLRLMSEKLSVSWFPELCPPTLITSKQSLLKEFAQQHGTIVVKPLDGMGGHSIFRIADGDLNSNVILETITDYGRSNVMAQQFIPEINQGDKRVLLIDGKPVPYALARVPAAGEFRGNLAAGGRGVGQALSERDQFICEQVGPVLKANGILFAGLDIIGDYLTEINITSPTCIRELDTIYNLDIAGQLMDLIASKLPATTR